MLWRIALVSVLFCLGGFGISTWAQGRGHDIETARTMVVNTFCVMEIFYLFSVRYLHASSFSMQGARGTPAVLWAIMAVVVAQLAFTYLPWMQMLFDSRPVPLFEGLVIIAVGAVMLLLLEIEKGVLRKLGIFDELSPAALPAASPPATSA
jgi:magnesium-transporting ATPase (P-type)